MNSLIDFLNSIQIEDIINFLIATLIFLIFFILSNSITRIILGIFNVKGGKNKKISELSIYKPINSFFKILGLYIAITYLPITENILNIVNVKLDK